MAKKNTAKKGTEVATGTANVEAAQALTAAEESGASILPDVQATPAAEEAAPAPKKGKGRKSGATPAKNVNERRTLPKKGAKKEETAPAATEAAPAPAKRRGRPRKDGLPPGTEVAKIEDLTPEESSRRSEIEAQVDKNMDVFIETSSLLLEVAERRLYRNTHKSFAAYVEDRFKIKGRMGWYQVAAAGVNRALTSQGVTHLPANEGSARPLASLRNEPEKLVKAWEVANEIATSEGVQEPTQQHTERAVARVLGNPEPTPTAPAQTQTPAPATPAAPSTPVEAAKANGTIPNNAEVSTTEVGEGDDEFPEEPPQDIEMRDDKWLAQFPLDSILEGTPLKRFQAEALAYRWMAGARRQFIRSVLSQLIKEAKRDSGIKELGPYLHRVRYGLTGPAPDKWVACDVCKHTGQVPTIGGCTACHKAGFIVPAR